MPSIHSKGELDFILQLGEREGWFGPQRGVFLGGTLTWGKVSWVDGTDTDFTWWEEEAPFLNNISCLAIFSDLYWKETSCDLDRGRQGPDFVICKIGLDKIGEYPLQIVTTLHLNL